MSSIGEIVEKINANIDQYSQADIELWIKALDRCQVYVDMLILRSAYENNTDLKRQLQEWKEKVEQERGKVPKAKQEEYNNYLEALNNPNALAKLLYSEIDSEARKEVIQQCSDFLRGGIENSQKVAFSDEVQRYEKLFSKDGVMNLEVFRQFEDMLDEKENLAELVEIHRLEKKQKKYASKQSFYDKRLKFLTADTLQGYIDIFLGYLYLNGSSKMLNPDSDNYKHFYRGMNIDELGNITGNDEENEIVNMLARLYSGYEGKDDISALIAKCIERRDKNSGYKESEEKLIAIIQEEVKKCYKRKLEMEQKVYKIGTNVVGLKLEYLSLGSIQDLLDMKNWSVTQENNMNALAELLNPEAKDDSQVTPLVAFTSLRMLLELEKETTYGKDEIAMKKLKLGNDNDERAANDALNTMMKTHTNIIMEKVKAKKPDIER